MGSKPRKPRAPAPLPPPVKPEDENVQEAGKNQLRRLYLRKDRNSQRMNDGLTSSTGGY